jgi:hypothetical protein
MKTSPAACFRPKPLISWAGVLLIVGLIVGLWFVRPDDAAWEAIPLAVGLTLTAAVGVTWQQFRARARRRLQAALDAHAEREIRLHQHRTALKRVRTLFTDLGVSSSVGKQLKPRTYPVPRHAAH